MNESFSGSYLATEVSFLMRRIHMETTALQERERLIQNGDRHYSEMIGPEDAPTRDRLKLFRECLHSNRTRFAHDLCLLAAALAATAHQGELVIVSIARAGTPIGVLLLHHLSKIAPELRLKHYSISVIRDRGVDYAALDWIMARHAPESLRFVDGWTGKGTIADELRDSIGRWPGAPTELHPGLWVPLDVCGSAYFAASCSDYLIPSTLLGGTLSGLVSRSVLPKGEEGSGNFHGYVPLESLRRYDLSRWFIKRMQSEMTRFPLGGNLPKNYSGGKKRRMETCECLDNMLSRQGHKDRNRVKLGIGETVRVLLRRQPDRIYLNSEANPIDAGFIRRLAHSRNVPVITEKNLPFDAIACIKSS